MISHDSNESRRFPIGVCKVPDHGIMSTAACFLGILLSVVVAAASSSAFEVVAGRPAWPSMVQAVPFLGIAVVALLMIVSLTFFVVALEEVELTDEEVCKIWSVAGCRIPIASWSLNKIKGARTLRSDGSDYAKLELQLGKSCYVIAGSRQEERLTEIALEIRRSCQQEAATTRA